MSRKLVAALSALLVAAQAVKPPPGYDTKRLGLGRIRIIGGKEALKDEFPHQVSLQCGFFPNVRYIHFCGGTIIDSQWILTAGHCALAVPTEVSFVIKAGKHDIQMTESSEQMVDVSAKIIHTDYVNLRNYSSLYDIALLKLKTPLSLNEAVGTISLPKLGVRPTGNGILSGWGSLAPNGTSKSAKLQKVVLPLINLATCKSRLEVLIGPSQLHSTNLCTGTRFGLVSACSGDSGGPLIQTNANGVKEVIGVASWGTKPCGGYDAPSVYTDVAQFVDWIQATIKNN